MASQGRFVTEPHQPQQSFITGNRGAYCSVEVIIISVYIPIPAFAAALAGRASMEALVVDGILRNR